LLTNYDTRSALLCFPGGTFVRYIRSILGAIPGFHSVRHWVDVRSHMGGKEKVSVLLWGFAFAVIGNCALE
jgi:hypothetical protein